MSNITNLPLFPHTVGNLDDRPNLDADVMKAKFESDCMALWEKLREAIPELNAKFPQSDVIGIVNSSSTDSKVPTAKAVYEAIADALVGAGGTIAESIITDWLADHPEATTTVVDGSVTRAKLDSNLKSVADSVSYVNSNGLLVDHSALPKSNNGITVAHAENGYVHISGSPSDRSIISLIDVSDDAIPAGVKGKQNAILCIEYDNRTTSYLVPIDVYVTTVSNPSLHLLYEDATKTMRVSIPSDVKRIMIRIDIPSDADVTLNDDISVSLLFNRFPNLKDFSEQQLVASVPASLQEPELNHVVGNREYILSSSVTYLHKPDGMTTNTGFLSTRQYTNWHLQMIYAFTGGIIWVRHGNGSSPASVTWSDWEQISGSGGSSISNTYNITTYPSFTTDTNGWLQAVDTETSDETGKTDMTGAIMSLLTDTGYCHLGEGIFYVSGNIDMPKGSMLCGCGAKSEIRLLQSVSTGYCVKMSEYCTIKDVLISGSYSSLTPSESGTRDGVHFVAGYSLSPKVRSRRCVIDNVIVRNFTGAGLFCDDTSMSPEHGLYCTNLHFERCFAGIKINLYSEFGKFTNVCTTDCYYGVINNSGNNVFTSCTFRATHIGFYVDGSKPNSAHGELNGCTLAHIGGDSGSAITMSNVTAGFLIANCHIWYNSVDLTNSSGIVFSGCVFGGGEEVNISGGNLVMFTGCCFMNDVEQPPQFSISSNTKVKFNGCFGSVSGNAVTGA